MWLENVSLPPPEAGPVKASTSPACVSDENLRLVNTM